MLRHVAGSQAMVHLKYVWSTRCRLDLGPANAATLQAQSWRPETYCNLSPEGGALVNPVAPLSNNGTETKMDGRTGLVGSDNNDSKYSNFFAIVSSLAGVHCSISGEAPHVSMCANAARQNMQPGRGSVRRYRDESVRTAMAATIAILGKIVVASHNLVWVPRNLARAFNLTTDQREKGTSFPRSKRTQTTFTQKLWAQHVDPLFEPFPPPKETDRMFLVEVARDFPRSQHDFGATCHRNSPYCNVGRWLWHILHRSSNVSGEPPELISDPTSVTTTAQALRDAVGLMRVEAIPVIVAVIEGMRLSAMRPLPEDYFMMDLEEKAVFLAKKMCEKRPEGFDYDAPAVPMRFQRAQGRNDPKRFVLPLPMPIVSVCACLPARFWARCVCKPIGMCLTQYPRGGGTKCHAMKHPRGSPLKKAARLRILVAARL
jgi:hypothetical protein